MYFGGLKENVPPKGGALLGGVAFWRNYITVVQVLTSLSQASLSVTVSQFSGASKSRCRTLNPAPHLPECCYAPHLYDNELNF